MQDRRHRRGEGRCVSCGKAAKGSTLEDSGEDDVSLFTFAPNDPLYGSYIDIIPSQNSSLVLKQEQAQAVRSGEVTGPACVSCFEEWVEVAMQQEKEALINHLRRCKEFELAAAQDQAEYPTPEALEADIVQLGVLEQGLLQELATLEGERRRAKAELDAAVTEGDKLQAALERCEAAEIAREVGAFHSREAEAAASAKTEHVREQLHALKQLSLLPTLFDIQFAGPGIRQATVTINGLHLAWTNELKVELEEVSAAWGMAALCLQATAEGCRRPFSMFRPVPNGSTSVMEDIRVGGVRHNLYLKDMNRQAVASFDRAVSAFVVCVYELAERTAMSNALPCSMQGDLVMGTSVYLMGNSLERWSQSVQYLFINLHRLLEHVSATHISPC
eukprot:EG_transcript_12507